MNKTSLIMLSLPLVSIVAAGCTKADSGSKEQPGQKQAAKVCAPGICEEEKPAAAITPVAEKADKIVVYYFHGNRRCKTCLGIQETIEETIRKRFANDTAAGFLVYKDVNIDEPANKRFIDEYQVSFSTMMVAAMKGDRRIKYENCEKVWDLAHDQPKLSDYVAGRIGEYLKLLGTK